RWHAQRVQNDVDGRAVFHKWHVLDRQDTGDHALVTVAAAQLVANRNLAHLGHKNLDLLDHAGLKLVAVLAAKYFYADHFAVFAITHALRRIADFFDFFAENSAQQTFF